MLNENTKEAIILILDYMSNTQENDNKNLNKLIEKIVDEKINENNENTNKKISNWANKVLKLEKEFIELSTIDDKIINKLNEIKESVNKKLVNKQPIYEITEPKSTSTDLNPKPKNNVRKKQRRSAISDKPILDLIPKYTMKQWNELQHNITKAAKERSRDPKQTAQVANKYGVTRRYLADSLSISVATVINRLEPLIKDGQVIEFKVGEGRKAPKIYGRIIDDFGLAKDESLEELYKFKDAFNNPGYDLIGGVNVKPRKGNGKPLYFTAKELYDLKKLIKDKPFTVALHDKLVQRMHDMGLANDGTCEANTYRLVHGFFDDVIDEYLDYQKKLVNPEFELLVSSDELLVNGERVKLNDVINILENIPYGGNIEGYYQKMIEKYRDYPSVTIRTLLDNYDDYLLKRLLKRDNVVENNPKKRKENGLI